MTMNLNFILAVIFVLAMAAMWRLGYKKHVKRIILALVVQAQYNWGKGTGPIKFSEVYSKLPVLFTMLFSEKEAIKLIELAVEEMKHYLEENPQVKAVIESDVL